MKHTYLFLGFFAMLSVLLISNCAVLPTCPGQLLPIVEMQVDHTASTHDDYINTTAYVPTRARVSNVRNINNNLNFPGGVEVEVRNPGTSTALILSPTNSGTSSSFFATLPADGSWFNFFVRGNSVSPVDKAIIMEMATAGMTCNEVVISRKGLQVTNGAAPTSGSGPRVAINVGSISHLDDYVGWGAISGTLQWLNPPNASATMPVTVRNMSGTNRLRFSTTQPAAGSTATNATVNLNLPGDGSTVQFWVAGNFGNASVNDKDAVLEVAETASGNILGREGMMVRVRKNVNSLQAGERDRYLEALRELHQTYNMYMTFTNSHSQVGAGFINVAHRQAHNGSAFLPWHRAFVLHIERLLQASDPSVSLPFWHFDQNSSSMFNANFLGSNPTAPANRAILNASNPIITWTIPGQAVGIQRRTPYGNSGTPGSVTTTTTGVQTQTATMALGPNYVNFKNMEFNTHNGAHNNSGNTVSWVAGDPALAPRDPLFYSLHCNIDRLWGRWQWLQANGFDPTHAHGYDLQQSHASPPATQLPNLTGNRTLGQYLEDTMWPWDNVNGGTGTSERPPVSNLNPFPIVLGGILPLGTPKVRSLIDYRILRFDYEDLNPY